MRSASRISSRAVRMQAKEIGIHGLVLSPEEAEAIRKLVGPADELVTPGIRPAGAAARDQKRIMTPALAIAGGADHLVVGRPVTEAARSGRGCRTDRRRYRVRARAGRQDQPESAERA